MFFSEQSCKKNICLVYINLIRISQPVLRRAKGWRARILFLVWGNNSSFLHSAQADFRIHQTSYPICIWGSFPRVKWPRREAGHSPPTITGVKNIGALYFQDFMVWCSIIYFQGQIYYSNTLYFNF
jgi:hypothetical protein